MGSMFMAQISKTKYCLHMGISINDPQMDGVFHGKSDEKWMRTGGSPMTQETSMANFLVFPDSPHL